MPHKTVLSGEPKCMKNLIQPMTVSGLSSLSTKRLTEPLRSGHMTIHLSFAHGAPRFLSQLPHELRTINELLIFEGKRKCYFFQKAYDLTKQEINWNIVTTVVCRCVAGRKFPLERIPLRKTSPLGKFAQGKFLHQENCFPEYSLLGKFPPPKNIPPRKVPPA